MKTQRETSRESSAVLVVLSAGRCGTQWLASTLRALYPDQAVVEHEPLGPLYAPRRHFRRYRDPEAMLERPAVLRHIERIERERRYIETGWPAFVALPLLAMRMPERLRVLHLTRHPVPSALSHLAHSSWAGSARDDAYTRLATLAPTDPRVFLPHYARRWKRLSPYEKCLYWWTEVNQFGLEFARRYPAIPLARIKSEELLGGDRQAIERLCGLAELPWDERWLARTAEVVDRWHHRTDRELDPMAVARHPATVATARELGYDLDEVDLESLERRYTGTPDAGRDRFGRFGVSRSSPGAPRRASCR